MTHPKKPGRSREKICGLHKPTTAGEICREPGDVSSQRGLRFNMTTLYGEEKYEWTRRLGKLRRRLTTTRNDLDFLRKCRDGRVTPAFLKAKRNFNTDKAHRIYDSMERALLRERIAAYRFRYWQLKTEGETLENKISSAIDPDMWATVDRITSEQAMKIGALNARKKDKKWSKLSDRREGCSSTKPEQPAAEPEDAQDRTVINLSQVQLPPDAVEVLKKGLNFAVVPRKVPIEDLITSVEAALTHMDSVPAEEVRLEAAYMVKRAKPPKDNITWAQRRALRDLRQNENIVVTRADKGNATVVLDKGVYDTKMEELLDPQVYTRGVKDPTRSIENAIKKILKNEEWDKKVAAQMAPEDSRVPRIYGLPKIHKAGTPLRPIVSMIGAPTYNASKGLAKMLKPAVGNTFSAVKNAAHLVDILKSHRVESDDILASFDVVSLFTSLPVRDTLEVIKAKGLLAGKAMELAELVLSSCYFQYSNVIYKQRDGVAMGSPLSSVVADIFMEDFESKALDAYPVGPKLWLRYVDDVFVIWQHGREELDKFLSFLNGRHPSISFTLETEVAGQLPFLDLMVIKSSDGTLAHTVYRKPTATGRYLHADSHHHNAQKKGVIKTLANRAIRLCSSEALRQEELSRLTADMAKNGFEPKLTQRIIQDVLQRHFEGPLETKTEDKTVQRISLPYVRGLTERIGRLFKKQGVDVAYRPVNKVSELLGTTKDRQWLQDKGVYLLPCDCGSVYVGQTGKKVATRIGQHCADYRLNRTKTSAVARHGEQCPGQMLFDQVKVLAKENRLDRRLIREAVEILKHPKNFNAADGVTLPRSWWPALKLSEVPESGEQHGRASSLPIGPLGTRTGCRIEDINAAGSGANHIAASTYKHDPPEEAR